MPGVSEEFIQDLLKGVGVPSDVAIEAAKILKLELENPGRERSPLEQACITMAWQSTNRDMLLAVNEELKTWKPDSNK